ncbi:MULTISPECIES: response regulator [Aliarcobacter]|jgi:two-component system, OmpR family, response regulator QseB|uniref:Response regulator n=4 Tax=Arcobacteraceae TaxID=2808963 RepID=A0AA96IK66_9BACT|nr:MULTISPECIES: response regulator [Aliarcobacter]MBP7251669.1 response regulator [Aliarcobacter sp.]MDX9814758.1 response regulator [Sulfurimonadaceae bacterium]WNL34471.1 response regulator [Arcobacter sp. AZ-2023]WPD11766.1 response regulator [Arcobacter sp. DSM 115960]AZL54422.1 response regulator [Aliarcobacter skirrowii]
MKILLIEDDNLIGDGIVSAFKKFGFSIDWFEDGLDGQEAIFMINYDAVILDLSLPNIDGLDILKFWREKNIKTPVIILTARDAINQRVEGLTKGADDYLCKPFSLAELHARVIALNRRNYNLVKEYLEIGDIKLYPLEQKVLKNNNIVELTTKEIKILELFILNKGIVLSREVIVEKLYDFDKELNSNALDVFIHAIRKKIGNDYIKTVYGAGYKLEEPKK